MRRLLSVVVAGALCLGLQCAVSQKLAWQNDAPAKGDAHQQVRFLYPEQVTVAAGKPNVVELHFKRERWAAHQLAYTAREESDSHAINSAGANRSECGQRGFSGWHGLFTGVQPQRQAECLYRRVRSARAYHGAARGSSGSGCSAVSGLRCEFLLPAQDSAGGG